MDRLIQMEKDLGYEGEKLQDLVKQQQDYERDERIAERELERNRIAAQEKERADKLAAQEKDREIELARIAAEEAKADKDRELERDTGVQLLVFVCFSGPVMLFGTPGISGCRSQHVPVESSSLRHHSIYL